MCEDAHVRTCATLNAQSKSVPFVPFPFRLPTRERLLFQAETIIRNKKSDTVWFLYLHTFLYMFACVMFIYMVRTIHLSCHLCQWFSSPFRKYFPLFIYNMVKCLALRTRGSDFIREGSITVVGLCTFFHKLVRSCPPS